MMPLIWAVASGWPSVIDFDVSVNDGNLGSRA